MIDLLLGLLLVSFHVDRFEDALVVQELYVDIVVSMLVATVEEFSKIDHVKSIVGEPHRYNYPQVPVIYAVVDCIDEPPKLSMDAV